MIIRILSPGKTKVKIFYNDDLKSILLDSPQRNTHQ